MHFKLAVACWLVSSLPGEVQGHMGVHTVQTPDKCPWKSDYASGFCREDDDSWGVRVKSFQRENRRKMQRKTGENAPAERSPAEMNRGAAREERGLFGLSFLFFRVS